MITYRIATAADTSAIAQLHARSWQQHYRGILNDRYLDQEAEAERLEIWSERLKNPNPDQLVVLAEEGDELCGFACAYLNYDPVWGAYLDNLHVRPGWKRQGIARELMGRTAAWVHQHTPTAKYHLLVLEKNAEAIKAYECLGGRNVKRIMYEMPDGVEKASLLYVWDDLRTLFER